MGTPRLERTTVNVFLSSTSVDLQEERRAVENALQRFRETKFVGMEYFGSRNESSRQASLDEVDRCQLYLGVFGRRYGSGITEAEYRRAQEKGLQCFVYLLADGAIKPRWIEADADKAHRLAALKDELRAARIASEFSSPDGLAALVSADLHRWLVDMIYLPAAAESARPDYRLDELQRLVGDVRMLDEGRNPAGAEPAYSGALVFWMLAHAPALLAQHLRVEQFRTLVEERTRGFVGRDFIFTAVADYIRGASDPSFRSGYIVIRGEPGIGKTAFASQLVRAHGYLHHFNIATQNIRSTRDFLGNVCAQLIVRYKLAHTALPPSATRDSGFLSQLLAAAAAKAGDPLVIVVDALDEAEDGTAASDTNTLLLPTVLPDGVFFVVTTRERTEHRLLVDRRHDIYIGDTSPQNLADVRMYILRFVDEHRDTMAGPIAGWGIDEAALVDAITHKSQGNFMYLVHILRDINAGRLTRANLDSIYDLPQGLKAYYQRHWLTMKSQDPGRFKDYCEPVVCILASAREPVPVAQLVEWTKRRWPYLEAGAIRDVLREWREFLNEERNAAGVPVFRIYHISFQDFLREVVGLVGYHDEIAVTALNKIPGLLDSPGGT